MAYNDQRRLYANRNTGEDEDYEHNKIDDAYNPSRGKHRFPYSIVWTPLPLITSILPMIGHTGICTSEGVIHDFAGSYYISVDDFAFGEPHKYVALDNAGIDPQAWDACVDKADNRFKEEMHNIFTNNCHSHVAEMLNQVKYQGKSNWNMVSVWWLITTKGKYVSGKHIFKVYIGLFIFLLILYLLF